ncbi:MAG: MBL fold metallo-hydrolase [Candidatus Eisenbacteria bacterium]|nr:MBL fold metallo-hydrolase [Candidatus Eisenbacteria bacterium]
MAWTRFVSQMVPGTLRFTSMILSPVDASADLKIEELAPGIHAVIFNEPLGLANHANTVFIINESDVVVVDTQFTLEATRVVLAALEKLTDKPVSCLINTHWHDDHTFGNQVWAQAYPGIEIISQEQTRRDLATTAVENRKQQMDGGPDAIARFQEAVSEEKTLDGSLMSAEERLAYESTIRLAQQHVDEAHRFTLTLPTVTFSDRLVLHRGERTIELHHFGEGVTRGDAVVWLPGEKIVVTGDLLNGPFPFTSGDGWLASLGQIRGLSPSMLVPGHGPVQRDTAHLDRLVAAFTSARDHAATAKANAVGSGNYYLSATNRQNRHLEQVMAGNNKMLRFLLRSYFVGPAAAGECRAIGGPH